VGHGSQEARCQGDPRRPAVHPDQCGRRPARAAARRGGIVFLGGLTNYVLTREKYFREYVVADANGPTILTDDFAGTEDLDGVFSGLDREQRIYDYDSWRYQGRDSARDPKCALQPQRERIGLRDPG
jgi:hypothetical protein